MLQILEHLSAFIVITAEISTPFLNLYVKNFFLLHISLHSCSFVLYHLEYLILPKPQHPLGSFMPSENESPMLYLNFSYNGESLATYLAYRA